MKLTRYCLVALFSIILLTSCNNEEPSKEKATDSTLNEHKQDDNTEEIKKQETEAEKKKNDEDKDMKFLSNIPDVPTEAAGFVNQKQGKYGAQKIEETTVEKKVIKDLTKLKPLTENANEEQLDKYFSYLYFLVADDFPNPKDLIKKWQFSSFGNPDLPDARYHFKDNYNVEIILDSSGSMAATVDGKTRMDLAKESINNFLRNIPKKTNVSLRVYGHKGSSSESDKKMSCGAIEQVYGFAPYKENKFQEALDQFKPSGWTPIASALKQSEKALKQYDSSSNTNLIYLVSDGIGTCDGNPVKVAESLSKSNAKPIINIIGFQTDKRAQAQLEKIAEASDGIYTTVNNQEELEEEFNHAQEVLEAWQEWKKDAMNDAENATYSHSVDILNLTGDWSMTSLSQWSQLKKVIYLAYKQGILTQVQMEQLQDKNKEIEQEVKKVGKEMESNLKDISIETIDELKKSIQQKYSKQTQN